MIRPTTTRASLATLLAVGLVALSGPAPAADQQDLGTFKDWSAFAFTENGAKICSATSRPKRTEHGNRPRGDAYVFVTHRPAERNTHVVSFVSGYQFRPGSEVTVEIGSETFRLFTENDGAWARETAMDRQIVKAMRTGARMVVRGTSARGTQTTDTYSLNGSGGALDAINKACNVKD